MLFLEQVVRLFGGIRSETLDFISSYSLTSPVTWFSLALLRSECVPGVIEGMSQRTPLFASHADAHVDTISESTDVIKN